MSHQVFLLLLQVGVAACQISRALGLRVLGTAGTADGVKLALSNGAHLVFNHREEGYTNRIMVDSLTGGNEHFQSGLDGNMDCVFQEATEGRGVDVIVEMLSNVNLSKDLQMLAYRGRVVVSKPLF